MAKKEEAIKKTKKKDVELPLIKRARGEGYTTDNRSLSRRFKNVKLQIMGIGPQGLGSAGMSSKSKPCGSPLKKGLWDNIHNKRKRIQGGSGETMRKKGAKGAPTQEAIKDAGK